jgi:hypothetical protein
LSDLAVSLFGLPAALHAVDSGRMELGPAKAQKGLLKTRLEPDGDRGATIRIGRALIRLICWRLVSYNRTLVLYRKAG